MGEDMSSNFSDTCYGSQFRILWRWNALPIIVSYIELQN
jgi:hypothetical protein